MDRYLIKAAYAIVAQRWHSGQWSKGYEKLCIAMRGLRLPDSAYRKGSEERSEAARLLFARRREIKREW